MSSERIAVYPGTFDPVTKGHLDIIERAVPLVDKLIIGVADNLDKKPLFSSEERVQLVQEVVAPLCQKGFLVEARPFTGLLVHFAKDVGARFLVRGLRAVSDFEYEFQLAATNRRLDDEIETFFLMASETQQFVSSRFVKEIYRMGGDVESFVSPQVIEKLTEKMKDIRTKR